MAEEPRTAVVSGETAESEALAIRHACPEAVEQVVLLGADRFVLRSLRPEDRDAYADFIARMDESDLRRRFVRAGSAAPESDLTRYTRLDPSREAAFVSVRQSGTASGEIVGEVRAYRYPEAPTAEVAVIVRSDMKGRGLGSALMAKMIEYCRAAGLELIAQIRPDNTAMIRLARHCGMEVEHAPGSSLAIAYIGRKQRETQR
jgi:acetyltransferase